MTDTNPIPARLARAAVSPAYAALTRRVGRGLALPLPQGGTLHASFDGGPPPARDGMQLHGPYGALWLADGAAFLRALTGIDLPAAGAVAADWLHAALLGHLQRGPLRGTQRLAHAAAPTDGVTLRLTLAESGHAVGTAARADTAAWQALLAPLQPERAPPAAFLPLVTRIPVRLGSHAVPLAVLGALGPGDVLLPDRPRIGVDGSGLLDCGGRRVRVRHRANGTIDILTLEASMEEQDGAAVAQQADLPVAPAPIDGAALRLDFELGTLALTLGELRTLGPGTVLELAEGGAGAIGIACGGKVLGQGEAVDVAGRLGIRITRWDAPC